MSDTTTYIFTLIYRGVHLIKIAVTYDSDVEPDPDVLKYFMEPENKKTRMDTLPSWINDGKRLLVDVERIAESVEVMGELR